MVGFFSLNKDRTGKEGWRLGLILWGQGHLNFESQKNKRYELSLSLGGSSLFLDIRSGFI